MTLRAQVKAIQTNAARLATNPLIPADARVLLADTAGLLAELVRRIEKLEAASAMLPLVDCPQVDQFRKGPL